MKKEAFLSTAIDDQDSSVYLAGFASVSEAPLMS